MALISVQKCRDGLEQKRGKSFGYAQGLCSSPPPPTAIFCQKNCACNWGSAVKPGSLPPSVMPVCPHSGVHQDVAMVQVRSVPGPTIQGWIVQYRKGKGRGRSWDQHVWSAYCMPGIESGC